jgi:hypothetical protein
LIPALGIYNQVIESDWIHLIPNAMVFEIRNQHLDSSSNVGIKVNSWIQGQIWVSRSNVRFKVKSWN